MISVIAASFLVVGFLILLKVLAVLDNSLKVMSIASKTVAIVTDKKVDDLRKERQLQAATIELFKLFILILAGSVTAVCVPAGLIWLFHLTGVGSWDETLATTVSWQFITASTVTGCVAFYLFRKRKSSSGI